uniref:Uncharacterized protein n=1 Tax=Siphoviridae sp. ctaLC6 TaxID=2826387 RepID=A0A8S5MQA2_9CAUD|nr:MAG TPA: hypothetical protein [Siphoviridae sp. ctaLC6]
MLQIYNKIFNHQIDSAKKCKTLCLHINEYIFLHKYCIISHIILSKYCIFKTHEIEGIKILSNVCKIRKD